VLDKYIGDGVMAIFGVPPRADDEGASDAVAAVEAAKKLSWSFGPLLEDWLPKWKKKEPKKIDIGLGCGVHTGDMLVGALGTGLRDQFTALGPHVNLTSRIENRAEKGQILISASTNELVKRSFTTRAIPPKSDLKGIEGNYELYEVL
jgi:class 3 adenylate cyclase